MKKTLFMLPAAAGCAASSAYADDLVYADFTANEFTSIGREQSTDGALGETSGVTNRFDTGKNSVLDFSAEGLTFIQDHMPPPMRIGRRRFLCRHLHAGQRGFIQQGRFLRG